MNKDISKNVANVNPMRQDSLKLVRIEVTVYMVQYNGMINLV